MGALLSFVWSRLVLWVLALCGRDPARLISGDSSKLSYMMEDAEESKRLEQKTDLKKTRDQLRWGGLKDGMHAMDLGCGMGVVTNLMADMVGPSGSVLGVDGSAPRIEDARAKYARPGLEFQQCLFEDLDRLQHRFDFIWCRFVLQFLPNPEEVVQRAVSLLRPGGVLCVGELDYNSMSHDPLPPRVDQCFRKLVDVAHGRGLDFYMGRRLYGLVRAQGLQSVDVDIEAHHCIYGKPSEVDLFNWRKKVEKMSRLVPVVDPLYPGGPKGFVQDFMAFFEREDSFTYTPLIKVRGTRAQPSASELPALNVEERVEHRASA